MTTLDPERVTNEYFHAASDYYATGRFAFWANSMIVCGNLLHHAIEFFLKGHLRLTMTPEELKDLNHNLPRIWTRFKTVVADSRLAPFDRTIQDVHGFEELRYPDRMFARGGAPVFQFYLRRAELDKGLAMSKPRTHAYVLALEEVDHLVLLLFDVCSRNTAEFLRGRLPSSERQKYLTLSNSAWTGA